MGTLDDNRRAHAARTEAFRRIGFDLAAPSGDLGLRCAIERYPFVPAVGDWPAGYPIDERKDYDLAEIRRWLEVFAQRFYAFSQFKRSAMPNGPKVSDRGSLSPRGDWRARSDLSARIWLADIQRNVPGAGDSSSSRRTTTY